MAYQRTARVHLRQRGESLKGASMDERVESQRGGPPTLDDSGQSRVERKRQERMRLLFRTAAEVFAERGFQGTNLEEIAARMHLRGPSLYHYVSSKEELFLRCVDAINQEVIERLRPVAEAGDPPIERLRRLFYQQALLEIRDYKDFLPLFLQVFIPDARIRDRVRYLRRRHGAIFEDVMREAVAAGEVPANRWKFRMLLALGALNYVRDWYDPNGVTSPEEFAEIVAAEVLNGLIRISQASSETVEAAQRGEPSIAAAHARGLKLETNGKEPIHLRRRHRPRR